MDNMSTLGYLLFSLDSMYIHRKLPLTDDQRVILEQYFFEAFDTLTIEEAVSYYLTHSNTNIKEV